MSCDGNMSRRQRDLLRKSVPDIPKGFSDAISKAISKDRGDRQGTAKQFEAELRAGLQSVGVGSQRRQDRH